MRETDLVARLGGDEFVIVQSAMSHPRQADPLAKRIIETIGAPFDIDGHSIVVGASIGIAVGPNDGEEPDQLLKAADMALYKAKAEGRGTFRYFEPELDRRMRQRRALEVELRQALANHELDVHYQALVDLRSNDISGFEALVRWTHPTRGPVPPSEFIPVAEEIGLINQIGLWVLRTACAEAMNWPGDLKVAVNLSPVQFRSHSLVLDVLSALTEAGLPAERLELEITETAMLKDTKATLSVLHRLRQLGVRISMDDFGTGYSSLNHVRDFPFDRIKIDQCFIRSLGETGDSAAIVRAITGLAASLNVSTTAEGVETQAQLNFVRQEGCAEAQGYLFSAPLPARELGSLLSGSLRQRAAA